MNSRDRDPIDYERSVRSVFVGNIPYEASEEQLKDIFNEVGTVVSFRLVFDRESGKPKGYGFAEYQDQETAMSAMRNLNGRELHGRALRVDHATSEKNRNNFQEEVENFRAMGPPTESEYGEPSTPQDAPEAISKAVASLPPEQMFELMKQMKQCIQNNPVEARNMLLQNPQLAYALLQAQVVMRIVDPEIAMKMLHRRTAIQPLVAAGDGPPAREDPRPNGTQIPGMGTGMPSERSHEIREREIPMDVHPERERMHARRMDIDPRGIERIPVDQGIGDPMERHHERHRLSRSPDRFGRDMREPVYERNLGMERSIPVDRGPPIDRGHPMDRGMMMDRSRPPVDRGISPHRGGPPVDRRGPMDHPSRVLEPGPQEMGPSRHSRPPPPPPPPLPLPLVSEPRGPGGRPNELAAANFQEQDQEKAALIMQVLQLTPEQIKMLPEEQRRSILALKDQLQGGRQ